MWGRRIPTLAEFCNYLGMCDAGGRRLPGIPCSLSAWVRDKADDSAEKRRALRRRGITPRIARRGGESSERLGRYRGVVERTLARMLGCRRLSVRSERRSDLLLGLLHLACALICLRFLRPPTEPEL